MTKSTGSVSVGIIRLAERQRRRALQTECHVLREGQALELDRCQGDATSSMLNVVPSRVEGERYPTARVFPVLSF